jgi:predicted RNase H-like nuclease (RuvC/YqgF family)
MTPTNIAAPITPVDDSKPKSEVALASLLEQIRERQDRAAGELGEWRALGKTPEDVRAELDKLKQQLAEAHERAERAEAEGQARANATFRNKLKCVEQLADSWKAKAERYEQVRADVLEARTYGDGSGDGSGYGYGDGSGYGDG